MSSDVFRYEFDPAVNTDEVEASLLLALIGAESLRGETETQLNAAHHFDVEKRVAVIDASTPVGHDFNALFAGFLRREFGPKSFRVRRVVTAQETAAVSAA